METGIMPGRVTMESGTLEICVKSAAIGHCSKSGEDTFVKVNGGVIRADVSGDSGESIGLGVRGAHSTSYVKLPIAISGDTVGGDGGVTVPGGGSTITLPTGGTVKPNPDGSIPLPGGAKIEKGGQVIVIPDGGRTYHPDGTVTKDVCTVTFDSLGGSAVSPIVVTFGEKVTKPGNPVRSGYTFDGWYSENNFTTAWNFDTDIVTDDITLYTKWTETSNPGENPGSSSGGGRLARSRQYLLRHHPNHGSRESDRQPNRHIAGDCRGHHRCPGGGLPPGHAQRYQRRQVRTPDEKREWQVHLYHASGDRQGGGGLCTG